MRTVRRIVGAVIASLACASVLPAAAAPPQDPISTDPSGILPLKYEAVVVVRDVPGDVVVRAGKPGEVVFESGRRGSPKEALPVALWLDGNSVRFGLTAEMPAEPRFLQITVPESMSVDVTAKDGRVTIGEVAGQVDIAGEGLDVGVSGLRGDVTIRDKQGRVSAGSIQRDLSISGSDLQVEVGYVVGRVDLNVTRGSATVKGVSGPIQASLEDVSLDLAGAPAGLQLSTRGGRARLVDLAQTTSGVLSRTPLRLEHGKGDITIRTDAEVAFQDMEADIHVESYGGAVRGSLDKGLVEAKTSNAEVKLEKIVGPVRVEGDGLTVTLAEIAGDVGVYATGSTIQAAKLAAAADLRNDGGDIAVDGASGDVQIESRGGTVVLTNLSSSATVNADGASVEASWVSISSTKGIRIRNEEGSVTARFNPGCSGQLEAVSKFGRIETSSPRLTVGEGTGEAHGVIGHGGSIPIRIEAAGDIRILSGAAQPDQ